MIDTIRTTKKIPSSDALTKRIKIKRTISIAVLCIIVIALLVAYNHRVNENLSPEETIQALESSSRPVAPDAEQTAKNFSTLDSMSARAKITATPPAIKKK